jgi:hypothetical protein
MEMNKKLQAPTTKHQRDFKYQTSMTEMNKFEPRKTIGRQPLPTAPAGNWMLMVGASLELGTWNLVLV